MGPTEFRGVIPSSPTRHKDEFDTTTFFIKDSFTLRTIILAGALIQILLSYMLPPRVALLPAAFLVAYTLLTTLFQAVFSPLSSSYMRSVIVGRTSAQLPDVTSATFGTRPAARSLVVFHFGVTFNHPLGVLSPGALSTVSHFTACNNLIAAKADEYGLLGLSPWRAGQRGSNNTLMMVYYFRDIEGLNKFAHDDIHRKAWDWIVKADRKHIGFFHEAFCVPKEAYESIYVNFQPLLMGQTSVKCVDENGEEKWVRPIVNADVGSLRSQFGRMGRAFKEYDN